MPNLQPWVCEVSPTSFDDGGDDGAAAAAADDDDGDDHDDDLSVFSVHTGVWWPETKAWHWAAAEH